MSRYSNVAPLHDRHDADLDTPTLLDRMRARTVRGLALSGLPRPSWLVDGLLPTRSVTMLYGPPKSGKSFVAIDLAACVATGRPWMGQPTKQGTVLYVVGEGASGVILRQEAWSMYHGVSDLDNIVWYPAAVNLFAADSGLALADPAADIAADLVVIDTLARCAVGAEESSAKTWARSSPCSTTCATPVADASTSCTTQARTERRAPEVPPHCSAPSTSLSRCPAATGASASSSSRRKTPHQGS
jgi:hypothetical protein